MNKLSTLLWLMLVSLAIGDELEDAAAKVISAVPSIKSQSIDSDVPVVPKKLTEDRKEMLIAIGITFHDDLSKEKQDFWDVPPGWEYSRIEHPEDLRYEKERFDFGWRHHFHSEEGLIISISDFWDYGRLRDAMLFVRWNEYYYCSSFQRFRYKCISHWMFGSDRERFWDYE